MSLSSEDPLIADDTVRSSYWKAVKLAVAIACIRMKPTGISAEEYTLRMHQNFWKSQLKPSVHYYFMSNEETNISNHSSQSNCEVASFPSAKSSSVMDVLIKCVSKFEELKSYFHNLRPDLAIKSSEFHKMEKELLQNCLSIVKSLEEVLSPNIFKLSYHVLSTAATVLCKGIELFEKYQNLDSFMIDVEEKSLCLIVNECLDFVGGLFLRIMNTTDHKFQKLCCGFLREFSTHSSLKLVVAKQALYWILRVKDELILLESNKLLWNDEIALCLNNVAHMFKLFENYLVQLMQQPSFAARCNSNMTSQQCTSALCLDAMDNNFLLHAEQTLQEKIFQCSGRFPLFCNWVFQLCFRISLLRQL